MREDVLAVWIHQLHYSGNLCYQSNRLRGTEDTLFVKPSWVRYIGCICCECLPLRGQLWCHWCPARSEHQREVLRGEKKLEPGQETWIGLGRPSLSWHMGIGARDRETTGCLLTRLCLPIKIGYTYPCFSFCCWSSLTQILALTLFYPYMLANLSRVHVLIHSRVQLPIGPPISKYTHPPKGRGAFPYYISHLQLSSVCIYHEQILYISLIIHRQLKNNNTTGRICFLPSELLVSCICTNISRSVLAQMCYISLACMCVRTRQPVPAKDQTLNTSGFSGHIASVATTQLHLALKKSANLSFKNE